MQKKPALGIIIICALVLLGAALPSLAQAGVTAEAIGQANLRAAVGTEAPIVGQISAGTRYPVLGRSEFFPWLLLGDPASGRPLGWVFQDLVTVQGNPLSVPTSTLALDANALVAASATPSAFTPTALSVTVFAPTLPPSATFGSAISGRVLGEINVRYGPGVEYPRLGVALAGDMLEVTTWHTQLPWVQVRYAPSPNGFAWVQADLLEYTGDRFSLPSTSQTTFSLPTLTPTLSPINLALPLNGTPVPLSPRFAQLGDQLWNLMLSAGFDPATSRLGTLFVIDLQTGEAFSFGDDIAFSGMSINKIAVLTELYGFINAPATIEQAYEIAEAMTCSENTSTNDMLSIIGNGDPYAGARAVTERLRGLGAENTFIVAPYTPDARIELQPVSLPTTPVDQVKTAPDPSNQMTVNEVGGLLSDIYQCAINETGGLISTYPENFSGAECRQIINTMSNNRINALIEMGVPEGTQVAHKHGWVDDTHGDAGIVFTPGGDYAIVVAVHNPIWMNFEESFPLIAEISRTVYNYYNPDAPMPAIREGDVSDQCDLLGSGLIDQLTAADAPQPSGG
jgi:uncharacterized protein YraI